MQAMFTYSDECVTLTCLSDSDKKKEVLMVKRDRLRRFTAAFMASCLAMGSIILPAISSYANDTNVVVGTSIQSETETTDNAVQKASTIDADKEIHTVTDTGYKSDGDEEQNGYDENLDNITEPGKGYREVEDDSIGDPAMLNVSDNGEVSADRAVSYPSSYKTANLPAIRNQGGYGVCWAFSTISLLEINLLKNKLVSDDIDLSEFHLVNFTYNNVTDPLGGSAGDTTTFLRSSNSVTQNGGDIRMAFNSLMDWEGAVDETLVPYTAEVASTINTTGLSDDLARKNTKIHLQNYYKVNMTNQTDVKQAITDYGALSISYYAYGGHSSNKYYNSSTAGYYCYDSNTGTNHAVTVVGWDDNYSKDNFPTEPEGDGAWIVRNSWGSYFGENGYFYLSYYDKSTKVEGYAVEAQTSDNYDNNYQYDGTGWFSYMGYSGYGGTNKYANVFTAKANESKAENIEAVSFEDYSSAGCKYNISIYTNLTDVSDPESGTLECTQSGQTTFDGAYTIKLNNPVYVEDGTTFSVVVELISSTNNGPYMVSDTTYNGSWFSCESAALENQSYIYRPYDRSWVDYGKRENKNFRIKAYTDNSDIKTVAVESVSLDKTEAVLKEKETVKLNATVLPENADNKNVHFTSDNDAVAAVDDNGLVTALSSGEAVITVITEDGKKTAKCKITVEKEIIQLKTITITNAPAELEKGAQVQLGIKYIPDNTTQSKSVEWKTSDASVAVVSSTGLVTAKKTGTVTITAVSKADSSIQSKVTIKVLSHITDVTVTGPSGTLYTDTKYKFTAKITPDDTTDNKTVIWSVSDSNIAQIAKDGTLSFKKAGTVDVIATVKATSSNTVIKKLTVTGVKRVINVSSVALDKTTVNLKKEETVKLNATIAPADADNKEVTYTSSNSAVAKVDNTGLVTALSSGEAVITVTTKDGSKTASCKVTVAKDIINLTGIQITNAPAELEKGAKVQLGIKYIPDNTTQSKSVEWKSSDTSVAVVSSTGLVTAKKTGTVTITAVSKESLKSSAVTIKVLSHITDVTVTGPSGTLYTDTKYKFTAKITPDDTTDNKTVIWSVSDSNIAQIAKDGTLSFKKAGTVDVIATVKATSSNTVIKKLTVTGVKRVINVSSVALDKTTVNLKKEETVKLNATIAPADADNKEVTYTSSNSAVAKVDNTGLVTALSSGEAVITVTTKDGSKTASCKVTVAKEIEPLAITVTSKISGNDYTFTANATGGNKDYTYKFIVYNRTTNSWGLVQSFGTANTCVWKKGSVGVRDFYVDVKDSNGTVVRSRAMTITINTEITPKPVITSSASEVKVGDKITLKVSSGDSTCSYKVIVYNKSTNQWGKIQDFGKNTTINWTAGSVGDREFYVDVKDAKGKVTRSKAVQVKVASRIIINTNVTNTNGTYTFTASVPGTTKFTYKFIVYNKTTKHWGLVQNFSNKNVCTWKAGSVGDRVFYIDVKDAEGKVTRSAPINVNIR